MPGFLVSNKLRINDFANTVLEDMQKIGSWFMNLLVKGLWGMFQQYVSKTLAIAEGLNTMTFTMEI